MWTVSFRPWGRISALKKWGILVFNRNMTAGMVVYSAGIRLVTVRGVVGNPGLQSRCVPAAFETREARASVPGRPPVARPPTRTLYYVDDGRTGFPARISIPGSVTWIAPLRSWLESRSAAVVPSSRPLGGGTTVVAARPPYRLAPS